MVGEIDGWVLGGMQSVVPLIEVLVTCGRIFKYDGRVLEDTQFGVLAQVLWCFGGRAFLRD